MEVHRENIFLIGFMGTGKSTVAEALCKKTGAASVEMDQVIADQQNMEISDIFAEYGEKYFRRLETELLREIQTKDDLVVSCGGGVVLKEKNVDLMRSCGHIVLLTAEPETIYRRIKNSTHRPLLNGNMSIPYIEELMDEREEYYKEAADITVETDHRPIEAIVEEIIKKLKRLR